MQPRDVQHRADLFDALAFCAEEVGAEVVQDEFGGREGAGAEFGLEAVGVDAVVGLLLGSG